MRAGKTTFKMGGVPRFLKGQAKETEKHLPENVSNVL